MPAKCSICFHERRSEIDRDLSAGKPYRFILARYGTSIAALGRHKKHVAAMILRASDRHEVSQNRLADSIVRDMNRLRDKIWTVLEQSQQDGDRPAFAAMAREFRQTLGGLFQLVCEAEKMGTEKEAPSITVTIREVGSEPATQALPQSLTQ
jgi:hypothetical protein